MSDQGPTADTTPTPPGGTPPVGDPTQAVPSAGAGPERPGSASVFGDGPPGGDDPTIAVPPVSGPAHAGAAAGTPDPMTGGPAGPGGPGGPGGFEDDEGEDEPWYTHPAAITAAALLGIIAIVIILIVALGGDDGTGTTTTTTTSSTTTSTTTTVATTEGRCRAGDQGACDEFSDTELQELCDDGATAACQVLLARQGDGEPDTTTTLAPAPSDQELCRGGDAPACGRLSDQDVAQLCGEGAQTACDEQNSRFDDGDVEVFREECRQGNDVGCQNLSNDDLVDLCAEGFPAACAELDSRTGE